MQPAQSVHPMVHLAMTHLRDKDIALAPQLPLDEMHVAVARYGVGMDYPAGEEPLAFMKHDFPARGERQGSFVSYVVTDRRLFGRVEASNEPRSFPNIPFSHVTNARLDAGLLSSALFVDLGNTTQKLPAYAKALHPFFMGLGYVPPHARSFPPLAPPTPSPEDPTGAWGELQRVRSGDPRAFVPLRVLFDAHKRGIVSLEDAAVLVDRMRLLARGLQWGRGMNSQHWLSTLSRPHLAMVSRILLGEPYAHYPSHGAETVDFALGASGARSSAAASTAVGLAMLAVVGVGWVTTTRGTDLTGVRVMMIDLPCGSGFQLLGTSGRDWVPLSVTHGRFVASLHQAIARIEARVLLAQALFGVHHPPETLMGTPREALEHAVAQMIGPTDLSAFFPPRGK